MINKYGIVPENVYPGIEYGEEGHVHGELDALLKAYVDVVVSNPNKKLSPTWKKGYEAVVNAYLGEAPKTFVYNGVTYTPESYGKTLGLNMEDYISITSFTHHPFYDCFVLEEPDNWEHILYYNVPIDSMEMYVCKALEHGQTVAWDGDTSEKGFLARLGMAIYPDSLVSQQDRQEAYEQFETTDDHMMHIIGTAYDEEGKFYYILKNSWGKIGPYKGLIYMSKEYFRAKTISVVLPKRCFD
jgi:bleomycin hydrolase